MTDTVTMPRSVVEQALEALESGIQYDYHGNPYSDNDAARCVASDALRAALEQPQSPYGECDECGTPYSYDPTDGGCICVRCMKEKLATKQPQVEQEPVAYYVMNGAALFQLFRSKSQADALAYDLQKRHDLSGSPAHFHVVPLYAHPQPQREPLTDLVKDAFFEGFTSVETYNDTRLNSVEDAWVEYKAAHKIGGEA